MNMFQSIKLALLLLFCLTACVGDGNLFISKLGSSGNDINGTKEPTATLKPFSSAFSAQGNHSLAINEDGELYAWGFTDFGRLGDGTSGFPHVRRSPVRIGTASNWVKVSAGSAHSLAINEDGELYAWGRNQYGQLGDGTSADKDRPVKICITTTNCPSNWVKVVAGANHSLAINEDGELYAWGRNLNGQLGDGTTYYENTPVAVKN